MATDHSLLKQVLEWISRLKHSLIWSVRAFIPQTSQLLEGAYYIQNILLQSVFGSHLGTGLSQGPRLEFI